MRASVTFCVTLCVCVGINNLQDDWDTSEGECNVLCNTVCLCRYQQPAGCVGHESNVLCNTVLFV